MIQYGGAIFPDTCPKCGEKIKMPKSMSVNAFMCRHLKDEPQVITGRCKTHGCIKVQMIGLENPDV